jgi:hypothetical protein
MIVPTATRCQAPTRNPYVRDGDNRPNAENRDIRCLFVIADLSDLKKDCVRGRFQYTYLQNRYTVHIILEWRKTPNIATFSLERWRS